MSADQYVNRRDLQFWLFELLDAESIITEPAFDGVTRSDIEQMIDTAMQMGESQFEHMPHFLDENEPEFDGSQVILTDEHKKVIRSYLDSGFASAGQPTEYGGMGLPNVVSKAVLTPIDSLGGSAFGYVFLTNAAAYMLSIVGNDEQKARYLPPMIEGRWFGTMALSEPQAGSSLGDIRTKAVKQPDGSYHLTGSKMWISGADHDMSENIIHMVLAKVVDESGNTVPGSKGISLFLVPKYHVNDDGSLGGRNGFQISGVNHKMGNRGTVNTVPVLGADPDMPCVGQMLGEEGKGLAGMFHMMNEARVGVGMGAAILGWNGYRYSLAYAKDRPQGRLPTDQSPTSPQVNIVEHTDVRRMLLEQKALSEGGMMLALYGCELLDKINLESDRDEKARLDQLLAILTPIIKSWPSIYGLHANYLAIQVLGGYGYTREYPVERMYRDNRLNEIHEGTTGIQSLDLLGRKVTQHGGAAFKILIAEMAETASQAAQNDDIKEFATQLNNAITRLVKTTQVLLGEAEAGRHDQFLADSWLYMDMMGKTVVAWMWLKAAVVAVNKLDNAAEVDVPFYNGKLRACQYFFRRELSKTVGQAELLQQLDDTCLATMADEL